MVIHTKSTDGYLKIKLCDINSTLTSIDTGISIIGGIPNIVSTGNSTTALLGISATFTGVWEEILNFASISIIAASNVVGTLFGEFSTNGVDVDRSLQLTDGLDGVFGIHNLIPVAKYFRVRVINDIVAQTDFYVQTMYNTSGRIAQPTSRLGQNIDEFQDVQNTRSVLVAQNVNGNFINIQSDVDGNLSVHSLSKPQVAGLGFKTSGGITVDGVNYQALECLGSTDTVYLDTWKSAVPLLGSNEFINIPEIANPVKIQMTSSSANDAIGQGNGTQVIVVGLDVNYNQVFDFVTLTGQTPSAGLFQTEFIRFIGFQITTSENSSPDQATAGNLFLNDVNYSGGYTSGTPNVLTECYAISSIGTGVGYNSYITTKPGAALFASELVISANSQGQSSDYNVAFFAKTGDSSPWRRLARLSTNSNTPTISLSQSGFPSSVLDLTPSQTLDTILMLCVQRRSGNIGASVHDMDLFLTVYQTIDV